MEVESGGDKQVYECIGHPVEIYGNIFLKAEGTVKESTPLCLIMAYQENLFIEREPMEHGETVAT